MRISASQWHYSQTIQQLPRKAELTLNHQASHLVGKMNANLRSCQTDTASCIHAAQHVARQITHGFIHLADAPGIKPQHVVSEGMDLQRSRF